MQCSLCCCKNSRGPAETLTSWGEPSGRPGARVACWWTLLEGQQQSQAHTCSCVFRGPPLPWHVGGLADAGSLVDAGRPQGQTANPALSSVLATASLPLFIPDSLRPLPRGARRGAPTSEAFGKGRLPGQGGGPCPLPIPPSPISCQPSVPGAENAQLGGSPSAAVEVPPLGTSLGR